MIRLHRQRLIKGFVENKKVNKTFECEGFTLLTNKHGGLVDMKPRIDDLYYRFYGRPIELVLEEFPDALKDLSEYGNS